MSETNRFDTRRHYFREFIKRRIAAHFSAGVATSRSQLDYLHDLGLPAAALFSGYNVVDNKVVWDTVQNDLPRLTEQLKVVLR